MTTTSTTPTAATSSANGRSYPSVQYSAAPQADSHGLDHAAKSPASTNDTPTDKYVTINPSTFTNGYGPGHPPDKSRRTCCQKWSLYSCVVGFVFIIASVICAFLMKPFVEDKILDNLPLREGSEVYKGWKDPPVTPVVSFRIFNLTNQAAFLRGLEKPNVVELGPYVYRQKMEKVDVSFSKTEPGVSYKVAKQYFFAPEMSCTECHEDDYVIVPNIPLFGAFQKMAKESAGTKKFFKDYLKSYDFAIDTDVFINVTVGQLLWGYPSLLLSLARADSRKCNAGNEDFDDWDAGFDSNHAESKSRTKKQVERNVREPDPCEVEPGNLAPFGLFVGRNGTGMDLRTVNTGAVRVEDRGMMISWHNKTRLNYWSKQECNVLSGRDPASLPLNIQKTDEINVFIGQLCRSINFKYVKEEMVSDEFQTFRFTPFENSFDSPEETPDNECYCLKKPCLPSGILDIRGCQENSPIFMSWPHFLHGDTSLVRGVRGLHPDREKHAFIMDIAPKYGITLRALARLQMNVMIEKNSGFGYFDKINQDTIFYPMIWLEDGILGPSEVIVKKVRFLLNLPTNIQNLVGLIGLAVGLLFLIPEIIFWTKSCCKSKKPGTTEKLERL